MIHRILCFFWIHSWEELDYDYEVVSRKCRVCGKEQHELTDFV
jgi:hypothetical protein